MPKHGKKFRKVTEAIDSLKTYDVAEAMDLVLKSSFAKFDETVDVAVNLGVNLFLLKDPHEPYWQIQRCHLLQRS